MNKFIQLKSVRGNSRVDREYISNIENKIYVCTLVAHPVIPRTKYTVCLLLHESRNSSIIPVFVFAEDAYQQQARIDGEPAQLDILDTAGQVGRLDDKHVNNKRSASMSTAGDR